MTDQAQPEWGRDRATSVGARVQTNPSLQAATMPPNRMRALLAVAIVVVLAVLLAAVWTLVAQRQLAASLAELETERFSFAHRAYEHARARTQAHLQSQCRVLVEDPRLKATLATEGMDAATVDDILGDIGRLRGGGFLLVPSPEGRVFAEAGAKELRGLDLGESSVVKKAQSANDAAVGSWVLGGKVMDLSIMAVRYGPSIIAYLVVGEAVDQEDLKAIADQSGVEVASALGDRVVLASSNDAALATVFARAAGGTKGIISASDKELAVSVVEMAASTQSHRLVLALDRARGAKAFELLGWMLLVPPALVLVGVLFAMSATRSQRRKQ